MKRLRALFIIVLICHVCAATEKKLNTARARFFTPSDFTSNNGRLEYEMTTVERVNRNGKRHSPHKHYLKYGHSGLKTGPLYYRLPAFGRNFNIRLRRDDSFVSPLFTVEHVFNDLRRLSFGGDLRHCFYRGDIHGDPNSTAVFNLCNGLRGSFVSNGERYFVEPVDEHKKNASINFRKFHIVFRRPTNTDSLSNGSTCGVQDSDMPRPLLRDRHPHHENMSKQIRRRKRSIDENFVETFVVADRTMVDAFKSKADLQSYILTLMGVVSQVYRDRTIGNPINIVVVKIAFLETNEPGIHISTDATRTLKSFCRWQKKVMTKDPKHPEHYDTAILLTKRNICRSPGRCDTLGLAELGTMCNPSRSCALVEDNGLSAAFTIAHELGHLFNLPHDGDNNPCTRSRGDQHIMARSLSFDNKPWSWSNCSRNKLTEFLDLGYGSCLADKPEDKVFIKYKNQLPGEVYSIDKQCQMVFGENSSLCPFMEPCRRLWCVKMIGRRKGCSTHHMPWADGTPCAKRKWCIRGQCVKRRRLKPVDGQWGQWGPYTECTRTCGGGISFSYRKCNNPVPGNGGKYCIGPRKRFKSCNTSDCPMESVDFRALQCENTHARTVTSGSKSYRITHWVPKYAGISKENQCKLYCRMAGTAIYFKLEDKVIDGTPCNRETTDICVDGKCMPAGCDRVLNSNKKADKCGVCDGDNSSCRRFSGTFNETRFGYNYIFTIPVESTDIVITQFGWKRREDSNYLALSDSGQFLLNGGMVIGLGVRQFRAAGSKIWYSGSEKATEQIKIEGKTTEPIKVHVLEVGEVLPPNVHYSLNQKVAEPKKFVYKWDHLGPWTQCSSLCQGKRKRRPRCVRAIDRQQVSNSRCDQRTRPSSVTEECNISCRLRWDIEYTGKCSERCGPGYQTRILRCIRVISDSWGEVLDKHCSSSTKPPVIVPCTGTCEGTKWTYTEWSKCSKTCNGGRQFRRAECVDIYGVSLKDRDCRPSDKQALRRPCNTFICPWWTNGTWSSCSVTCGSGQRTRLVKCVGEQGDVGESLCNQRKKPATTKSCDLESCPYWFVGKWTDCSQSCDNGTTTRQVMCLSGGKVAKQVDDAQCSNDTRPQARKVCKIQDCETRLHPIRQGLEYYWRISMWTPCSVSCGEKPGTQYRDVECVFVKYGRQELVDEKNCAHTPKPDVMKECAVSMCWRHGSWGRCSRPCGNGVQLRVVKCTYENFKITDDKNCDLSSKPLNKRSCQIRPCVSAKRVPTSNQKSRRPRPTTTTAPTTSRQVPIWHEGHWSQCSVTCGEGQRTREVICRFTDGRISTECDGKTRPQRVMDCVLRACPVWREEPWTECSVSCGQGFRQRNVDCRFRNGQISRGCSEKNKPALKELCNVRPCPTWMAGDWGRCSVTCGSGVKQRTVECSDKDISCDAKTKPQTTAPCNRAVCPQWKTRSWGECSVSCGDGIRERNVYCSLQDDQLSPGCNEESKPAAREGCNIRPCPTWMAGDWGKCSVTCGSGIKQRSVECSDKDFSCDASTKPQTTEICDHAPCPLWTPGPWEECSVSCGEGIRQRSVACRLKNGQISPGCASENKPPTKEGCNIRPCPTWMTGDWGKCSATCGAGVKQRSVECSDQDLSCDPKTKPKSTAPCDLKACPQWTSSSWGRCSVSCGEGVRQRTVNCRLQDGRLSPGCNDKDKPAPREACNIRPCPAWMTGDWGECSVTCGSGVKRRSVECSDKDFSCEKKLKPQSTAPCELAICPQWKTSDWNGCSVTCGNGFRRRTVRCTGDVSKCDYRSRPKSVERCNPRLCPTWIAGEWVKCSKTCGNGIKTRAVNCSGSQCDTKTKPASIAECNLGPCAEWKAGAWQQCSVTCGKGWRRRTVECTARNHRCDYRSKPDMFTMCDMGMCPMWRAGLWSKCSVTCGNGVKTRSLECTGGEGKCNPRTQPYSTSRCYLGSCPEWKVGGWGQCSVSCGSGIKKRPVKCSGRGTCDSRTQPQATTSCNLGLCPEWNVGVWSQCSATCGSGLKQRNVTCSRSDVNCDVVNKPISKTKCVLSACPVWKAGEWGQCSVTCGDGIKSRTVQCSGGPNNCDPSTKPETYTKCSLSSCPQWRVSQWSACSASCGEGVKERSVECRTENEKSSNCDPDIKPTERTSCNLGLCPHWKIGEWTQCSVTCGSGTKQRKIQCVSGVNATCDQRTKPVVTENCNLGQCPMWYTGRWTQCSRTCGSGIRRRAVACFSMITRKRLQDSACNVTLKPAGQEDCTVRECFPQARWRKGEWSKCSVYCGLGGKTRDVWCSTKDGTRVPDVHCASERKPRTQRPCNKKQRCGEWEVGLWTECSATCGEGTRERAIRCLHVLKYKGLTFCDHNTRPADRQACNKGTCPATPNLYHWETSAWTECSNSCGYGRNSRDVWCVDSFKRNVSDALCNPASKPENATLCHGSNCPSKWKHGDWSRCSTTCGRGYQLRTVECVGNTECDRRTRPPSWRLCNMGNCYGFLFWRVGPWSPHCSVSCGRGIVKRAVRCLARNGTYADDSFCATPSSSKPETSRVCQMKPCPPTSCKEVQSISGLQTDGEQTLMVQGKELQVYCHKMMSAEPKEYITLKTGPDNNFAEFYPKRLRNARECPSNGSHFEECNCEDEDYRMSGGSYFSKVRLDLSSMRIITEDRTFASTRGLNPPAYATAGDCYSAQGECPQGRFSINLRETGIRLTSKVMWGSTGQAYYQIIYRYPEGFEVIGKCGGRCGSCSPEADVGLLVELADDVS